MFKLKSEKDKLIEGLQQSNANLKELISMKNMTIANKNRELDEAMGLFGLAISMLENKSLEVDMFDLAKIRYNVICTTDQLRRSRKYTIEERKDTNG